MAVSRHGRYFITRVVSRSGVTHYMLYGPDSASRFQDLTGSAGPYGPTTGGALWPDAFTFVNDKGATITIDRTAGTFAIYEHGTHRLFDLPVGLTPQAFNNRNNVAGPYTYLVAGASQTVPVARYAFQTGQVKTINPGAGSGWSTTGGFTTDLSDTDEQVGTTGYGFAGHFFSFGFGYLVGTPIPLVYNSDALTPFAGWTEVNAVNDSHMVAGGGSFYGIGYEAFVGDFAGRNARFLQFFTSYTIPIGTAIDNENRVLGSDEFNRCYLWDAVGAVHDLVQISGGQLTSYNAGVRMDLAGRIYGTFNDPNGALHIFILTPP